MLKFYNSTPRRDFDRFEGYDPLKNPKHKFVPWFIKRATASDDYVQTVGLVDQDGNVTDISAYFETTIELLVGAPNAWSNGAGNQAYDTFTPSGLNISQAVEAGDAFQKWGFTNILDFTLKVGDVFYLNVTLALTSGVAPDMYIGNSATLAPISNVVQLSAGVNKITFKVTQAITARLVITSDAGDATDFAIIPSLKGTVRPHPVAKTDDYLIYKGGSLSTLLPNGIYSIKLSDNLSDYYSDWICISDLQPTLGTDWNNIGGSFNDLGYDVVLRLLNATESGGDAGVGESDRFAVIPGEEIYFSGCLRMTSGETPTIGMYDDADDSVISADQTLIDGNTLKTYTSDRTATAYMKVSVTNNSEFTIANITVYRAWGDYIRMVWDNTNDVRDTAGKNDLLYSEGLTQEIFLNSPLNTPVHESAESGQEKDGTFVADKITATPRQRIIDYIPRSTYEQLISLPAHDTVTIWDEAGNKYLVGGAANQAAGNIEVNFDFTYFEIGTLEILFNETSYYWTENINNVT